MNKRKTVVSIASVAAVIAFCLFLFLNSAQDANKSTEISNIFVDMIMPVLALFGIECKELTVSFYVRKSAHFLGYFSLTLLIYALIKRFFGKRNAIIASPIASFFISLIDEFIIQGSANGRSPEWRDVFIDLAGALLATLILCVRYLLKKGKNSDDNA